MDEVEAASSQQLEALEYVFRKAAEADMPSEFPDYLCCAITLGILQDPLITPYGHTYDKEAIIRHLEGEDHLIDHNLYQIWRSRKQSWHSWTTWLGIQRIHIGDDDL
ncbi:hypothetical protein QN277_023238 [Acacia crassicarpa]|uniref:RING-type E3 ubiquitin transferase n=1 Tax=Acacia crassicarpa TaxID=499986 RepID=A0AAE1MLS0_9FABA|nr:hypothetical protein QN277_023238 [Acacia crassicarpa]